MGDRDNRRAVRYDERGVMRRALLWLGLALGAVGCGDDGDGSGCDVSSDDWAPAFDAEPVGWMMNVAGACDDLYAVGGADDRDGDGSFGVAWRFDGAAWSEVDLGVPRDELPLLNWTMRFAADDVVVVGNDGLVLRWDGTRWDREETPTTLDLWGVWGAAPDDVWAVGGGPNESPDGPTEVAVALHWDGTAWREVDVPGPEDGQFFKVWGTGADDVLIVGSDLTVSRWDGATWAPQNVRWEGGRSDNDLISLWGTGPDRIAIAGGRNNGILVTWDGGSWTVHDLSPVPGLNGVWMGAADDGGAQDRVHMAGAREEIVVVDFATGEVVESYFGDVPRPLDYHAIFGDGCGNLWAVGANFLLPARGIASTRRLGCGE